MFRRILYRDDWYRLSVGMFGGMRIDSLKRGGSIRLDRLRVNYLNNVVAHYQKLGGRIDPTDEGLMHIFEMFTQANCVRSDNAYFRTYYEQTPEAHAEDAILFSDIDLNSS